MGFKDGTRNADNLADKFWASPAWMGIVVIRKIRIALEH